MAATLLPGRRAVTSMTGRDAPRRVVTSLLLLMFGIVLGSIFRFEQMFVDSVRWSTEQQTGNLQNCQCGPAGIEKRPPTPPPLVVNHILPIPETKQHDDEPTNQEKNDPYHISPEAERIMSFFDEWQTHTRESETPAAFLDLKSSATRVGVLDCETLDQKLQEYNEFVSINKDMVTHFQERDSQQNAATKSPKRRRVLFLSTIHSFHMHMDRWFYYIYQDASRLPGILR